ncbi:MAG: sulfotransferase [Gammaproteobacteria bacterium]|nr:sulfotransferase [Gammaproteobacteria bacterium]
MSRPFTPGFWTGRTQAEPQAGISVGALPADRPRLSVIVIVYDMAREAPRTLQSLSPDFQINVNPSDYEVIVVDNGSPRPLGEAAVRGFGPHFRYIYVENASPSPCAAVNLGFEASRGEIVGVFIDGARIATPGLLERVLAAFQVHPDPVVATHGWHLGPNRQQFSIAHGYNKDVEDGLLEGIGWPRCGYRLFEISTFAGSSRNGLFFTPPESNAVFMPRERFRRVGGFDLAFASPGGGLANFDFFKRVVESGPCTLIIPFSEGTFHQLHGGISTNVSQEEHRKRVASWFEEYRVVKGKVWAASRVPALYIGPVRPEVVRQLGVSLDKVIEASKPGVPAKGGYVPRSDLSGLDFLGIGGQRCGTTWLFEMLRRHPSISLPEEKELHFWDKSTLPSRSTSLDGYLDRLRQMPGPVRGEITPAYSVLEPGVIENIHRMFPALRLLYLIRNPIERAWSQAKLDRSREFGKGGNGPGDDWYLRHFSSAESIARGDYERCLRNWLQFYPRDQMLVRVFDELQTDPAGLLSDCFRHLGVEPELPGVLDPEILRRPVFSTRGERPKQEYLRCLEEIYSDKIASLSAYLGQDFASKWLRAV